MRILVCGANGFIGRHLVQTLSAAGHQVTSGVRVINKSSEVAIDYMRDLDPQDWLPRLRQVDVVINAVGILTEGEGASFDAVHRDAPKALFAAAAIAGVRVIQISALGGAEEGRDFSRLTPYMRSKREADAALMSWSGKWLVLRPSLLVGVDGASSRLFRSLSSLPAMGLPGKGEQLLQPVHIDDLCDAVLRWLADDGDSAVINAVGPAALSYRAMLETYRQLMDLPPARYFSIPMPLMRVGAYLAGLLPQKVLSPDTLRMLQENNVADAGNFSALLKRSPRASDTWFEVAAAQSLRTQAMANWNNAVLRCALAALWLATGVLSLGVYPVSSSLELLAALGLHGSTAIGVLYGAAVFDIAMGLACLLFPRRTLWLLQIMVVLGYTALVSVYLPQFWLHPFGPILKNIPILAILVVLYGSEQKPSRQLRASTVRLAS
ncbi:MAG: SDR family oxidoreductase [Pseudomonadota bacterium]